MTATLTVNPETMRHTAAGVGEAASHLHENQAGPALSGAAGAIAGLATATACEQIGASIGQRAQSLGKDASAFADKLRVAADRYDRGDHDAAESIDFSGPEEPRPPDPHPPVRRYEQALQDAGLLEGPAQGRYEQWLANASKNGVPPSTIVDIARTQDVGPEAFAVLDSMEEVKDGDRNGKSFFIIPPGTSAGDMKKAAVMTYVLNAGTGYEESDPTGSSNDYAATPYSAEEVRRIVGRQNANSWSYTVLAATGRGAAISTTPNGMLMGLGGPVTGTISVRGGTTYGDVFTMNIDAARDPGEVLRAVINSGNSWYQDDDGMPRKDDRLDLDRLLHHEEIHSEQWAQKGFATMARDYGLGAIIERQTGVNPLEREAGLSDGGYR